MKLEDALTLVNTIVERNREARINCGFAPDEFSAVARAMAVQCVQAAVLEEREACAKLVETHDTYGDPVRSWFDLLAAAIRSRGEC